MSNISFATPEVQAYAEFVASLEKADRQAANRAVNTFVVANQTDDEAAEAARPPVRKLGEYLDAPIETPPMLVEPGLVARGAITAMTSRGGKGKTAVSLNRLLRWSMGKPLFDELPDVLAPTAPLRVLLIENEGVAGHFQEVVSTILGEGGYTDEEIATARENVWVWGDGGWSGLKVDREEDLSMISRACAFVQPDILFVEPFRGLWTGEENSATDMANVMDSLNGLANQHQMAVMLTHHETKSGPENGDPMNAARGSGVITDLAAVVERWKPVKGNRQRELEWTKTRFREAPAPVRMEYVRKSWSYRYVAEDEKARAAIQAFQLDSDAWHSIGDLAEEMGETYDVARRQLAKLYDAGRVDRRSIPGQGINYRLKVSDGDDHPGLAVT